MPSDLTVPDRARPEQGRLATAMGDPRFDRWRTRRGRRALSLTHGALTVVLSAALAVSVDATLPGWAVPAVLLPPLLVWMMVTGLLNASANGMTELGDADLDEIQRQVRDVGYRRAYRIAMVLVTVLATLIVVGTFEWTSATVDLVVGFVAFLIVLSLPVHVLAWTLPDPLPED